MDKVVLAVIGFLLMLGACFVSYVDLAEREEWFDLFKDEEDKKKWTK